MTDLGERDNKLQTLQQQIINKQNFIISKLNELRGRSSLNNFLTALTGSYEKNLRVMLAQKEKEETSLRNLESYLDGLNTNVDSANSDLTTQSDEVKNELRTVVDEINNLKAQITGPTE